jgi:hypothetical protein
MAAEDEALIAVRWQEPPEQDDDAPAIAELLQPPTLTFIAEPDGRALVPGTSPAITGG